MSDLFNKDVPESFISSVFDVMEAANWHTFQILSKRSSRLRSFINRRFPTIAPNHLWLGVSVEDRTTLRRIEHLRQSNAAVRFLSIEPLLEDLGTLDLSGIHWVIVGGESGPRSRPIEVEWVQSIRDQCLRSRIPFFFKQWGGLRPKSGGNELDGQTWLQYPQLFWSQVVPQT
jgi:protein gp37